MNADALRAIQTPLKQRYREDPATGGDGSQLCSGDMLLEALAACAGVTLRAGRLPAHPPGPGPRSR